MDGAQVHTIYYEFYRILKIYILISLEGTIEEYEGFIAKNETILHQNHYHFLTAKHTLLQMLGRSEGCLIQDMPMEKVNSQNNFVLLFIIYYNYILYNYF